MSCTCRTVRRGVEETQHVLSQQSALRREVPPAELTSRAAWEQDRDTRSPMSGATFTIRPQTTKQQFNVKHVALFYKNTLICASNESNLMLERLKQYSDASVCASLYIIYIILLSSSHRSVGQTNHCQLE